MKLSSEESDDNFASPFPVFGASASASAEGKLACPAFFIVTLFFNPVTLPFSVDVDKNFGDTVF